VREFITHDENRLLVSCFDPKGLANTVLEDAPLARRLRDNACRYAEQQLAMDDDIAAYEALIRRITGSCDSRLRSETRGLILGGQRADEFVEFARHDAVDLV
jgi:hypothetical protein